MLKIKMKFLSSFLMFILNTMYVFAEEIRPSEETRAIDNTIDPCDDSATTSKPNCDVDAGSIRTPPKTLDEQNGIAIPPKEPIEPTEPSKPKQPQKK